MNVHVRVNDPDPHNKAEAVRKMGAVPMHLQDVLSSSDILSLHVPMVAGTENLIDEPEFQVMKEGAYLINVARGGVVNESALLKYLENGKLAGAAMDVLMEEPPKPGNPLLNYQKENLIITPHAAWFTSEAEQKNDDFFTQQVRDIVNDAVPKGIIK